MTDRRTALREEIASVLFRSLSSHGSAPRKETDLRLVADDVLAVLASSNRTRFYAVRQSDARCAECDQVRHHVSHEMDPDTSPEGPAYHADFAHHPFVEPVR